MNYEKEKNSSGPVETEQNAIYDFADAMALKLQGTFYESRDPRDIAKFPMLSKQAFYVMDWKKNKITYSRNIESLLGYNEEEFTMKVALGNIHPDDRRIVTRITRGIVGHYIQEIAPSADTYLTLTYRFLKKDGSPIKLFRQTGAFELSNEGNLISNWSLLTAVDFISNNNQVEWHLNTNEIDLEKFKENVYLEFKDFFTPRELLVIHGIRKGLKSSEIANELCISMATVNTHRKNILRKSNCHNKEQLLEFCGKNGIL